MPKIVDKTSKRKKIAKIAMDLFAKKSFEITSIREITLSAGIGKGTFYDYFKDKEDLLNEIVHLMFAQWTKIIISKIKGIDDPLIQLKVLLKEGAKLEGDEKQLMIIYVDLWRRTVSLNESSDYIESFQNYLLNYKKALTNIIETAKIQGKIRNDADSEGIASGILALIDGLCMHHMILKTKIDIDAISNTIFKTLLNGIQ